MRTHRWIWTTAALLLSMGLSAQCAMCKATAQTDLEGGAGVADVLNSGILYLMLFPYLLMGGVAWMWYRHHKQKSQG